MGYQQFQNIEFLGCQIDLSALNVQSAVVDIKTELSILHNSGVDRFRRFLLFPATHKYLDTCLHFQNIKRLGDIIIRPGFKSHDLIHICSLSRKKDDGHV